LIKVFPYCVGPCQRGMVSPSVADGGDCEYIE